MINHGLRFDVKIAVKQRRPGLLGYFRKRVIEKQTHIFSIYEPTLSTLDRLSALWLKMELDETKLTGDDFLATAKKLTATQTKLMAEVVATAVLGEDYYITTERRGRLIYTPDDARLQELTATFYHSVKPSQLLTLAVLISNVANLGDFISSMRLMSAARTSTPIADRIEQPA